MYSILAKVLKAIGGLNSASAPLQRTYGRYYPKWQDHFLEFACNVTNGLWMKINERTSTKV